MSEETEDQAPQVDPVVVAAHLAGLLSGMISRQGGGQILFNGGHYDKFLELPDLLRSPENKPLGLLDAPN